MPLPAQVPSSGRVAGASDPAKTLAYAVAETESTSFGSHTAV